MTWSGIKENTLLAMETLAAHKFRAALTILGVFIGVVVIVAVAAVLNGFRATIVDVTESFGTRNVYVSRYPFGAIGQLPASVLNRKPLTLEDARAIESDVPAAEYVSPELIYAWPIPGEIPPPAPQIRYHDKIMSRPQMRGGFPVGLVALNRTISNGRYFTDSENEHRAFVCVIAANVADALFPAEDPVGKAINFFGHDFTVIGCLPKDKTGLFGGENPRDNDVLIPYYTFKKMIPSSEDILLTVRMREGRMKEGTQQMEQVLRRQRKVSLFQDDDFGFGTAEMFISTFDDITRAVFGVTLLISSIAFMVGGVGVMNIMLVAVTERTREIGIRKAVGARRSDIVWQFLIEAVTLTCVGGLGGLLFGWAFALLINKLVPSLTMRVPLWAAVISFLGSVSVGIVFGMWPALKASRLDPIAALRYE
ncbi:MAG TPA: ABC transporter permease [Blastocatellia bacterium]